MRPIPEGWRTISMGQIMSLMNNVDQAELLKIVENDKSLDGNIKSLKKLFKRNAEALRKEGINADYLAYAVAYTIESGINEETGTSGPLKDN